MNVDALVPWTPDFAQRSPLFDPLRPWAERFAGFDRWPGLADFQRLLDALPQPIRTRSGAPLTIVGQDGRPGCFEEHYAPRIYLTGELQTRSENWHDFFQFLTWFLFPQTKAVINALHLPRAKARIEGGGDPGRRSPLENMLSLFDEGGAVVVASDPSLLQLIREFRWKELFWERRAQLQGHLGCIVFGHAVYEKGLMPYVGMTANAILLEVDRTFFTSTLAERLAQVDTRLADLLEHGEQYAKPGDLQPFPLLGMPGWSADNEREDYYDNVRYFRPGRGRRQAFSSVGAGPVT